MHAFCLAAAAILVWLSGRDPNWRKPIAWPAVLAASAAAAIVGLGSFVDAIRHSFVVDIRPETAQPVTILAVALAALWLPTFLWLYLGPYGFRPWTPVVLFFRNFPIEADSSLFGGQDMKVRIAATLVVFLGIAGFAGARPLDLTNRLLVHGAPTELPDPSAMVIAYTWYPDKDPDGDIPEHAWQSAEAHAWRNVRGADLSEFRFPNTNFSGSNVLRADFTRAALRGARFDGVQGSEARFDAACLAGATFRDATLIGTSFSGADFTSTDRPCPIRVAKEDTTKPADDPTSLAPPGGTTPTAPAADLSGAVLPHADFRGESEAGECSETSRLQFPHITLDGARLDFSDLHCFQFDSGVSLKGTSFIGVNLEDANFNGLAAFDPPPSFVWANLAGATFQGASEDEPISLRGIDFRGADLTDVTFKNVDLTGALFACADLRKVKTDHGKPPFGSEVDLSMAVMDDTQRPPHPSSECADKACLWRSVLKQRGAADVRVGGLLPPEPGLDVAGFINRLDEAEQKDAFDALCPKPK